MFVIVMGLTPEHTKQFTLFNEDHPKHPVLMQTIDRLNQKNWKAKSKISLSRFGENLENESGKIITALHDQPLRNCNYLRKINLRSFRNRNLNNLLWCYRNMKLKFSITVFIF